MAKSDSKPRIKVRSKPEDKLTWQEVELGGICVEPGSAAINQTGDWRSRRPVYDFSKCIKCALCQTFCPDGCIEHNLDGTYEADLFYCKGCGICAKECPTKVITMIEEKE